MAALAAAVRPENVASLTMVEPPAGGVARDDPEVAAFNARVREVMRPATRDPVALLTRFFATAGVPLSPPDPLPPVLETGESLAAAGAPFNDLLEDSLVHSDARGQDTG